MIKDNIFAKSRLFINPSVFTSPTWYGYNRLNKNEYESYLIKSKKSFGPPAQLPLEVPQYSCNSPSSA